MQLKVSDQKFLKQYKSSQCPVRVNYIEYRDYHIRYGIINDQPHLPTLLFIHGAPGFINDMKNYFTIPDIFKNARIVTFDRPGYGKSNPGKPMVSIQFQAETVLKIIQKEEIKEVIAIGHSYGGPIAAKLARDYPEKVSSLLLLAPALDPEKEIIFKMAYLIKVPLLRKLIPTPFKVAAVEKLTHREELKKLVHGWKDLTVPLYYFHGTRDWIVPYENMAFVRSHFKNAPSIFITLKGNNHFINFIPHPKIVDLIKKLVEEKVK